MPTVTLKYNLPEEQEEFDTAMNARKNASLLWDVEQEIFRPARKHGYNNPILSEAIQRIDELVERHAGDEWPRDKHGLKRDATDIVSQLETLYYEMKNEEK